MKITQDILDDLTAKAKESPRLRMNLVQKREKFLNRILPDKNLIKTEENFSNAIAFTVSGDNVKMKIAKFDEYIKAMIAPV